MNEVTKVGEAERKLSYRDVPIAPVGGGGMLLPQNFGDAVAFAQLMSGAQHAIPKHLRNNAGACLAVTMQALRWGMDPFLVASKSYSVNDMVAYESQLVNAVVNTRAPIRGRLKITFEGEGNDRVCFVTGTFDDGTEQVYVSPPRQMISPKNSPLWKTDPDQQHAYNSTRAWARRFCPEVLLGVYAEDELEPRGPDNAVDVTPRASLADKLKAGQAPGFRADAVDQQTRPLPAARETDPAPGNGGGDDEVATTEDANVVVAGADQGSPSAPASSPSETTSADPSPAADGAALPQAATTKAEDGPTPSSAADHAQAFHNALLTINEKASAATLIKRWRWPTLDEEDRDTVRDIGENHLARIEGTVTLEGCKSMAELAIDAMRQRGAAR